MARSGLAHIFPGSSRQQSNYKFEDTSTATVGDEVHSDDDDSLSSILSSDSSRFAYDHEDDDDDASIVSLLSFHELSLLTKWQRLEARFARRDRFLHKMQRRPYFSHSFCRVVLTQEYAVRKLERAELFLSQVYSDRKMRKKHTAYRPSYPWLIHCYNWAMMEQWTLVPAVGSLILHSLAHIGLYDLIYALSSAMRPFLETGTLWEDLFYTSHLLVGVFALRLSGYLYWWLNSHDYACTKFALHNRRHLHHWDALMMQFVRRRSWLRAFFFIFGYYMAYLFCQHLHGRLSALFDQSKVLLESLPSVRFDWSSCRMDNSTCCPFQCQAKEVCWAKDEALQQEDDWYTWQTFSRSSYDHYWNQIAMAQKPMVLMTPMRHLLWTSLLVGLAVAALYKYGFVFWLKY